MLIAGLITEIATCFGLVKAFFYGQNLDEKKNSFRSTGFDFVLWKLLKRNFFLACHLDRLTTW